MSEFVPKYSLIESISQGVTTTVTFTEDCDFIVGEIVSFRVSPPSGMFELNNKQTTVSAATSDTITVPIDSTNYNPFVFLELNSSHYPAMVVPAGSGVLQEVYNAQTQLQDVFDNVP